MYCLEFDAAHIVTGSRDRTIKVWALAGGRLLGTFFGHAGSVLCLKFEPDWARTAAHGPGGFMVSGSSDCTVLVWAMAAAPGGEVRAEVRGRLAGHTGGVLDLRMDAHSIVSW